MATQKKAAAQTGGLETALANLKKKHGGEVIARMGDTSVEDQNIEVIPTGIIGIDMALGRGGFPRGRIIEVYGPESSGKTTLALNVVAQAQRMGGQAVFIDAEHALDPVYARALGVDVDNLFLAQPDNGEQAFEIAEEVIKSGEVAVVVIDSVAALTPKAEIEGEMTDANVGAQARMMSKGLRKITGIAASTGTMVIFINQLREKIGVMFGCFSYDSRVMLADGTTEKIGKLVNAKEQVEVLSYNANTGKIEPKKIVSFFDNGKADRFLQFKVAGYRPNGFSQFAATENHMISTPDGWEAAGDLKVGDLVLTAASAPYSDEQVRLAEVLLLGDGCISPGRNGRARLRLGHGSAQVEYLEWKASKFQNVSSSKSTNDKASFVDFKPSLQLTDVRNRVYSERGKNFSDSFIKSLTPAELALWYMDDGHLAVRSKGKQERTQGGTGRITICVKAMTPDVRVSMIEHLGSLGVEATLRDVGSAESPTITMGRAATDRFLDLVTPYIHPTMRYKTLDRLRDEPFVDLKVSQEAVGEILVPAPIVDIYEKPQGGSMQRFDIEVEGNHNYFVDGTLVHNSPETTTGGKALKFYASIRVDVRGGTKMTDGKVVTGTMSKIKVVKNKVAPPFKEVEVQTEYGRGYLKADSLVEEGIRLGVLSKSGSWITYGDMKKYKKGWIETLDADPDFYDSLYAEVMEAYRVSQAASIGASDPDSDVPENVDPATGEILDEI